MITYSKDVKVVDFSLTSSIIFFSRRSNSNDKGLRVDLKFEYKNKVIKHHNAK